MLIKKVEQVHEEIPPRVEQVNVPSLIDTVRYKTREFPIQAEASLSKNMRG